MHIAILGATSQIAKDLILAYGTHADVQLTLFARRPEAVQQWLQAHGLAQRHTVADFQAFGPDRHFDALINFVGVGNPAQTAAMGGSILDITCHYDGLALAYLARHPTCRYLFLSSGSAYGVHFDAPVQQDSKAQIPINQLRPQDWYGIAKLHAECRHRALPDLPIVDLRVFNYFSHSQDIEARFLITDAVRAIRDDVVLKTSSDYMVRDYLIPQDFHQLVHCMLQAAPINLAVDCYSQAPVDKSTLLGALREQLGLRFETVAGSVGIAATGHKPHYYSLSRRLADFGYAPQFASLDGVLQEARKMLGR